MDFTRGQTEAVLAELRQVGFAEARLPDGPIAAAAALVLHQIVVAHRPEQVLAGFLVADNQAIWTPSDAAALAAFLRRLPAEGQGMVFSLLALVCYGLVRDWPALRGALQQAATS